MGHWRSVGPAVRSIGHRRETWPSSWERDPQLDTTKQHFPFSSALVSNAGQRHVDVDIPPTTLRNVPLKLLRDLLQELEIVSTQLLFVLGQQDFFEIQRLRDPAQHEDFIRKGVAMKGVFMPPDSSEKPFVCVDGHWEISIFLK